MQFSVGLCWERSSSLTMPCPRTLWVVSLVTTKQACRLVSCINSRFGYIAMVRQTEDENQCALYVNIEWVLTRLTIWLTFSVLVLPPLFSLTLSCCPSHSVDIFFWIVCRYLATIVVKTGFTNPDYCIECYAIFSARNSLNGQNQNLERQGKWNNTMTANTFQAPKEAIAMNWNVK